MIFVLLFLALLQDPTPTKPDPQLPPDLIHVSNQSCIIAEHSVAEVLDAKTGKREQLLNYRVEPYAEYDDHRERWELPKETVAHSREQRPGAIGDFEGTHEAIDACMAWTKKVKDARVKENEKMAHGGPKVLDRKK